MNLVPLVVTNCLFVGAGGAIGAVARYLFGLLPFAAGGLPLPTLLVNFIGSIVIGALAALAECSGAVNPQLMLFLRVGFCGGFTTFSTFALESSQFISEGNYLMTAVYAIASFALCVAGLMIAQAIVAKALS